MKKLASEVVRDKLKQVFGKEFKEYYIGDPIQIPQHSLPCIVVDPQSGNNSVRASGLDEESNTLLIKIVVNKKLDFGLRSNKMLWRERLERYVTAKNDNGTYYEKSILGVLRQYFSMDDRFYSNNVSYRFRVVERPQDQLTDEAHVTLDVKESVSVNNRS